MRSSTALVVLLAACTGGTPTPAASDTDPPGTIPLPEPDGTADTAAPDPVWAPYIVPPSDVDAACWSWTVTWRVDLGEPDDVTLSTRDAASLKLLSAHTDRPLDGVVDRIVEVTWDASFEEVLRQEIDEDGDGSPDQVVVQEFDPDTAERIRYALDSDGDGTWDRDLTYTWVDGAVSTATEDEGGDGTVDILWTWSRDAQGRSVEVAGDRGQDGTVDHRITRVWDDTLPVGHAMTETEDDDVDGVPERTLYQVWDADERVVHEETAFGTTYRSLVDRSWTPDGDVSTERRETWFDGELNDIQHLTYLYEAPGRERELTTLVDFGDGITVTRRRDTAWTCPPP